MTFNIPHHSAAPLRPVSDYRTLLSLEKTPNQTSSHKQPVKLFRSRCTAPCWVNTVTHRHTRTLQSLHCFFFPAADIFLSAPLLCCCFSRSRFWPGVMTMMMMLIITLCGVTTLNGARLGHRLPPLLSYFFGVFKAICNWDSTTAAQ